VGTVFGLFLEKQAKTENDTSILYKGKKI